MANYVYKGPGPAVAPDGTLVRPNDTCIFDEEPSWGPWQLLSEAIAEASAPVLDRIAAADRAGVPVEEVLKADPLAAPASLSVPPIASKGM